MVEEGCDHTHTRFPTALLYQRHPLHQVVNGNWPHRLVESCLRWPRVWDPKNLLCSSGGPSLVVRLKIQPGGAAMSEKKKRLLNWQHLDPRLETRNSDHVSRHVTLSMQQKHVKGGSEKNAFLGFFLNKSDRHFIELWFFWFMMKFKWTIWIEVKYVFTQIHTETIKWIWYAFA